MNVNNTVLVPLIFLPHFDKDDGGEENLKHENKLFDLSIMGDWEDKH